MACNITLPCYYAPALQTQHDDNHLAYVPSELVMYGVTKAPPHDSYVQSEGI